MTPIFKLKIKAVYSHIVLYTQKKKDQYSRAPEYARVFPLVFVIVTIRSYIPICIETNLQMYVLVFVRYGFYPETALPYTVTMMTRYEHFAEFPVP